MYRLRRFGNKKKTKGDNVNIFTVHSGVSCLEADRKSLYICTVDPGIKNFCFRVAEFDDATDKFRTIVMEKFDLTQSLTKGKHYKNTEIEYYGELLDRLEPYTNIFLKCQYIGIEAQLPINYDMIRMGQHCISYFMCLTRNKGNKPIIMEIDPKLKSSMLRAPPKMKKKELKDWAHQMGVALLRKNDEHDLAHHLELVKKGDDYGDVILYSQVILLLLESHILPYPGFLGDSNSEDETATINARYHMTPEGLVTDEEK